MKKFMQFALDDNNIFFYAVNDIVNVKFYTQNKLNNELTMELTTKSNGIETFTFNNIRDYQDAIEAFNDL